MAIYNLGGGSYYWGFIDGMLNATCQPIFDQEQFYCDYRRQYGYKYQSIVTLNGLVSSFIRLFISQYEDWKIVELSGISKKLRAVNRDRRPAYALYLYGDPTYSIIYGIMGPYKNYPQKLRTVALEKFNKTIVKL